MSIFPSLRTLLCFHFLVAFIGPAEFLKIAPTTIGLRRVNTFFSIELLIPFIFDSFASTLLKLNVVSRIYRLSINP